jgi:mono/diheme cytochrome c family protein
MRGVLKVLLALVVIVVLGAAGFFIWASSVPAIAPIAVADRASLASDKVEAGERLVALGDCVVCHTAEGGEDFAGGRPLPTPFGTIHSTNITPDRETGIGEWSLAAFTRAVRQGVSREGYHLYPAFPYDHMTKMRDDDIRAVYAFLMTRRPVAERAPQNDLPFPYNIRALVAGWKLLFLDRGALQADATKDAEWNRGAYLVEGLAHCGACHTPRNALGAEKRDEAYGGGETDGWFVPALNEKSPAGAPWTKERLHAYLGTGFDPVHGLAAGPMAPVVENLSAVPDTDVKAMAAYVAATLGPATADRDGKPVEAASLANHPGAAIYAGACAQCHGEAGRSPVIHALDLATSSTLRLPQPDNAIRIIRAGIRPVATRDGSSMPPFGDVFTDEQMTSLVDYLRQRFVGSQWTDVAAAVQRTREKRVTSAQKGASQ